ncbi:MAG: hypothetical protein ACO391_02300, partial [Pseudomonadales bacterium]
PRAGLRGVRWEFSRDGPHFEQQCGLAHRGCRRVLLKERSIICTCRTASIANAQQLEIAQTDEAVMLESACGQGLGVD